MELRQGTRLARRLRTVSTDAERALWLRLRNRRADGRKFRRQVAIDGYVVDFVCPEAKLVIEVDGGKHAEQLERDAQRSEVLAKSGFRVLRFGNNDVLLRLEDVVEEIFRQLHAPRSPQPFPASGRGG